MNTLAKKNTRSNHFHTIKSKQPYQTHLLDIDLIVGVDVFPPDFGATTLYLANEILKYKTAKTALDMGTGCGFLALQMRRYGIPNVWAVDIHKPAIDCTLENVKRNPALAPIHAIESDLFSSIPTTKFDLIVFNHPYYPTVGKPVFGYNPDGGKEILSKFFATLNDFCHSNTSILLPFSSITESEHDPKIVASNFDKFKIKTLLNVNDNNGSHKVYELTFK